MNASSKAATIQPHIPRDSTYTTRPISFTLWVDDFGIKYTRREDVLDLTELLGTFYEYKLDWSGTKYLGITLRWDYQNRTVDLSMPGYIQRGL